VQSIGWPMLRAHLIDQPKGEAMAAMKFALGRLVTTPAALAALNAEDVVAAIRRHVTGDWGELDEHDRKENELSLREGFRLLSAYTDSGGTRFWIITEADRSVTTVLLPEDY
jgi:hypothetical protein